MNIFNVLILFCAMLLSACHSLYTDLSLAPTGSFKLSEKGVTEDLTTDAHLARLRTEVFTEDGLGGGFALDWIKTDDDLSEGIDSGYEGHDLFVFFGVDPGDPEHFRVPLRVGILYGDRTLDIVANGLTGEISWTSWGVGLEVHPQVRMLGNPDEFSLWAFADLRLGALVSTIEVENFDWNTSSSQLGAHLGLRGEINNFHFSLGYLFSAIKYEETDPELVGNSLIILRESTHTFNGIAASIGIQF